MFGLTNLKLIAIAVGFAAAVTAIAVPAYKLGGSSVMEAETARADKAIKSVTDTYVQLLIKQQQLTDTYRDLADQKYGGLMAKLGNIKVVHTTVTNNITKERADNPAFYEQQLPPGGLKQWQDARNLFR